MGSVLSVLASNIFKYFQVNRSINYQKKSQSNENHIKCRSGNKYLLKSYQSQIDKIPSNEIVYRSFVPDDKVNWSVNFNEYKPIEYTSEKVLEQPVWADDKNPTKITNWNQLDDKIDRRSFIGKYEIIDGRPINPIGRTGVTGRGQLGKWGVNHAADPVVTRWKRDSNGNKIIDPDTNKHVLQFVAIQRLDTKEWAIPGGMCDPGENISLTLKREFMEEATDCLGENKSKREEVEAYLNDFFKKGEEIYQGYVDDPRNTDNAWMETTAYNFHDEDGEVFKNFHLSAGDDAGQVTWMTINKDLNLYASHRDFVELITEKHNSSW